MKLSIKAGETYKNLRGEIFIVRKGFIDPARRKLTYKALCDDGIERDFYIEEIRYWGWEKVE